MIEETGLEQMTREIMEQGYDRKTAGRFASLIGDLPIFDKDGNVIVQDERGRELAKLKPLSMFNEKYGSIHR